MTAVLERYELKHPALSVIESDAQNAQYTAKLRELMDQNDLSEDDRKYLQLLAMHIENYERERFPIPAAEPHEVLAALIEMNNLRQKDLVPLLGPRSVVSELVSGTRPLSKTNIERLSRRFHVSPAVFFARQRSPQRRAARNRPK